MSDLNWESPDGNYLYDYTDHTWSEWEVDSDGYGSWTQIDTPPAGLNPPPIQWSSTDATRPPTSGLPTTTNHPGPTPPKIPGGDGTGNTSVDTPSLDLFVTNVSTMLGWVTPLTTKLKTLAAVQPGAFYHADVIRAGINGDNGDGGLKAKYRTVLSDLGNGLTDLHDAVKNLSHKYTSVEEANKGTADDVSRALNGATGYFGGVVTDAGGSGQPPAGG